MIKLEDGTGLGPTLEFYALVAAELQRKDLAMWLCDDLPDSNRFGPSVIDDSSMRPPGYYVQRSTGLFPAPLIQDSSASEKVCRYFRFLGIFIAKVFQDGRLVDLPLSRPFFKLLCSGEFGSEVRERYVMTQNTIVPPRTCSFTIEKQRIATLF